MSTPCPDCQTKADLIAKLVLENEKLKRKLRQLAEENQQLRK